MAAGEATPLAARMAGLSLGGGTPLATGAGATPLSNIQNTAGRFGAYKSRLADEYHKAAAAGEVITSVRRGLAGRRGAAVVGAARGRRGLNGCPLSSR